MVLGAEPPRGIAENELKLSLSMGEGSVRNTMGKRRILVVLGAESPRGIAENELRGHRVESQKMSLS